LCREQENRERVDRREERQARLIQQLNQAQPVVPHTIQINQHKLGDSQCETTCDRVVDGEDISYE